MARKTTEQFVKEAKLVHGDKYDYSKVNYVSSKDKVEIICPIHGSFFQAPNHHLHNHGCPVCAGVKRLDTEEFIRRAKAIHGDKYDYSKTKYVNKVTKVTITCPIHGDFEQKAEDHYRGSGCQKCWFDEHTEKQTYTWNDFLLMAREKHGWKYDYSKSEWIDYTTPILIVCPKHGEFWQRPDVHIKSMGCPKCGREKANLSESFTKDAFINKAIETHNNKYDYSLVEYKDYHTKVKIICPTHGIFEQTPTSHANGQGCPKCLLKSQTKLWNKMKKRYPGFFNEWEYSPEWLNKQRLDIADKNLCIAIEFDGIQHYEPVKCFGGEERFQWQQEQDRKKEICCKENKWTLLRLRYDYRKSDFENLCSIIDSLIKEKEVENGK